VTPPTHPPPSIEPQASEPIYVRGDKIGTGPSGTVYRALHTTLGLEVAIKELNGAMLSRVRSFDPGRLRDMVGQQVRLRHPAVLTVHDLDLSGTLPVVAVELCEAGNLRGFLSLPGVRQQTQLILRAFAQVLDALAVAHEAGFAHGNLKAENVLFDRFGNARLSDFGLAALRDEDSNPDAALMPYLSPEQVEHGALQPSSSGDIYSVGVLLYEALVNRVPNRRAPFPQKLEGELPSALAWVLQHMVADQPSDRYRGASDCLRDYLRALGGDPRVGEVGKVPFSTRSLVPEPKIRGPAPSGT
jgi:serine/threonine protein kinase